MLRAKSGYMRAGESTGTYLTSLRSLSISFFVSIVPQHREEECNRLNIYSFRRPIYRVNNEIDPFFSTSLLCYPVGSSGGGSDVRYVNTYDICKLDNGTIHPGLDVKRTERKRRVSSVASIKCCRIN